MRKIFTRNRRSQISRKRGAPRVAAVLQSEQSKYAMAAFKGLRTTVVHKLAEHQCNSVLVTGATAGVGKSSVSINLAASLANQPDRRVILVEFDLRRPSLAKSLGVTPTNGIETAVSKFFDIEAELIKVPQLGFECIVVANAHRNSSEILTSTGMKNLLLTLATDYANDIVVFDAPPAIGCDDIAAIAPYFPLAVLVIEEGETTRSELNAAINIVKPAEIASVVSNKSRSTQFRNYYY